MTGHLPARRVEAVDELAALRSDLRTAELVEQIRRLGRIPGVQVPEEPRPLGHHPAPAGFLAAQYGPIDPERYAPRVVSATSAPGWFVELLDGDPAGQADAEER